MNKETTNGNRIPMLTHHHAIALVAFIFGFAAPCYGHPDAHAATLTEKADNLAAVFEAQHGLFGLKPQLVFDFNDSQRLRTDFLPLALHKQSGAALGRMTLESRRAANDLLRSTLSEEGYLRVQAIQSLEEDLRQTDVRTTTEFRLADNYSIQLFGQPSADSPWGMKWEGHHVSVNLTVAGRQVSGTPLFLGANPQEILTGPQAGFVVLRTPSELANELVASLDEKQRATAVAPSDLKLSGIVRSPLKKAPELAGITAREMTERQRHILHRFISHIASHLHPALATQELAAMEEAGFENIHLLWQQKLRNGRPQNYCRVQGPTLLIEYEAFEEHEGQGISHIHLLWRNPERDYGRNLLEEHHKAAH